MGENWNPSTGRPGYLEKKIQRGPATIVIFRPSSSKERETTENKARTALEIAMQEYQRRITTT